MREDARAVVIGGGVGGCSVLYHLAKLGWTDVVLLEQYGLTHGSTWHSAGLVGQLRSTVSLTKMMQYSVGLYAELARETGKDPGWHELGFWVAAGFCAHGLAGAGGMGWQVAEWIVNGEPSLDLWHMDSRRFGRQYRSQRYALARATEVYSTYYDIKYPNHEREAGRPLR